ncbi:LamB/YcsF family protein [Microvirga lotononidis]|uniref:5-oxoprolinase subunit A n=1 Tax=Microvirga lotononidis TaxID=864069 RepID=I4YUI2_9HYPH|nr:5-oxoprolinase subunit PxpA [Microvirga lotononidis]EIM27624.1 putative lactam utilization protein B-like protein [Microvirga lotononidis]WQO28233.1 5-oxoprolinase subunit PxpA [Microvirga lotononidis]
MNIDLNCDMGEGFGPWPMGDDEAMLDIVSSANIACGYHAGDPSIMFRTAEMAKQKGVAIGAHPGFNDLHGFGRRVIRGDSPAEIERMVAYQIGAMQALAALAGHKVTYVKAHGSLNNMANEDMDLALAIARAIKGVDASLVNVCMPGLLMEKASEQIGVKVAREIFADRTYEDDGTLTSRKKPGAVLHDAEFAAERILRAVQDKAITTVSGKRIPLEIDTICVHGDEPSAVAMARTVRAKLEANGITIAPFAKAGS